MYMPERGQEWHTSLIGFGPLAPASELWIMSHAWLYLVSHAWLCLLLHAWLCLLSHAALGDLACFGCIKLDWDLTRLWQSARGANKTPPPAFSIGNAHVRVGPRLCYLRTGRTSITLHLGELECQHGPKMAIGALKTAPAVLAGALAAAVCCTRIAARIASPYASITPS